MGGVALHSRDWTGDVVALCSRAEAIKKYMHTRKLPGRKES
jgi:hypothetical protein